MSEARFEAEIAMAQRIVERIEEASRRSGNPPDQLGTLAAESLVELNAILEELGVAGEELDAQNLELLAGSRSLERERQRFRDIFDAAPGAYIVTDHLGMIRQANDQAYKLLERASSRSLLGRPLRLFVDPEERREFARQLDLVRRDDHPLKWTTKVKPEHHPAVVVDAHVLPVHTGSGIAGWEVRWLLIPVAPEPALAQRLAERGFIHEMIDAIGVGAYVADVDGVCVYANPRTELVLGERLAGLDMTGWPRRYVARRNGPLAGDGEGTFARYLLARPDGSRRWVAHHTRVLRDHEGMPDGIVGTVADITALVEAEDHTIEANQRLQGILDQASDAVISADEDHNIILFNRAAEAVLGYKSSDVLGRSLSMILPPEAVAMHSLDVAAFAETGASGRRMGTRPYVTVQRASGEWFSAEVSISAGTIASKRVYVAILRDATEQIAASEEVGRVERRYRAVFDQAIEGMLVVDLDGNVLEVNRAYCHLLGVAEDDVRGRLLWPMMDEQSGLSGQSALGEALADGSTGYHLIDQCFTRPDGSALWANVSVSIVSDPEDQATYLVHLIEDITGKRELEAQLHHLQRIELAAQLGSGLAHDLNNVLTVLRGQLELLQEEMEPDPNSARRLAAAQHAVDRASGVVSGLLGLSRKPAYAPELFDLNDLVQSVAELTEDLLGADISLELDLRATAPLVLADAYQIEQVLISLLVNARDAMPDGGSLLVCTSDSHQLDDRRGSEGGSVSPSVAVSVTDSGIGMDAGTRAQVFTPFFTTKPPGSGTGLGLSQALQAVSQSRGAIDVESSPGSGSTFTVALPRAPVHPTGPMETAPGGQPGLVPGVHHERRILVVDDEAGIRDVVSETLDRAGFQVIACASPGEAAEVFAARTDVDLVLTDLVMPGESGLSLARRFHTQRPWTPVVVMSAHFDETLDREALGWTLDKPFTSAELLAVVRGALEVDGPAEGEPHDG